MKQAEWDDDTFMLNSDDVMLVYELGAVTMQFSCLVIVSRCEVGRHAAYAGFR